MKKTIVTRSSWLESSGAPLLVENDTGLPVHHRVISINIGWLVSEPNVE